MKQFPYTVHISPSVISQKVLLGETVIMDVKTLSYFGLDEFGSGIWRALDSTRDAQQAFEQIRASFDIEEGVLARKYQGILKGLEMSKIITLEPLATD